MEQVSIRDLRSNGAAVLGRVERGEAVELTRDGRPIARITPLPRSPPTGAELLTRARALPPIDADHFRRDVDELLDQRW